MSEEKYRLLTENTVDIIYSMALDGTITHISSHVARYGYTPEQLISRNISEVIDEEDLPRVMEDIRTTLATERSTHTSFRLKDFKENPVWLEDNGTVMKNAEGVAVGISGVLRDITERKRAEAALNESQQHLAEAMDLARLVNWEYDIGADLFTFDNRFYSLYGTTAEREGGTRMSAETYAREFVHPDDRGLVAQEVQKCLDTPDPRYVSHVEHRIVRRDGEVRYISVRIAITKDAGGRTIRTHGANQDITERRRAEEVLREREEQLRSVLDNLPDLVLVHRNGIILYANPAMTTRPPPCTGPISRRGGTPCRPSPSR